MVSQFKAWSGNGERKERACRERVYQNLRSAQRADEDPSQIRHGPEFYHKSRNITVSSGKDSNSRRTWRPKKETAIIKGVKTWNWTTFSWECPYLLLQHPSTRHFTEDIGPWLTVFLFLQSSLWVTSWWPIKYCSHGVWIFTTQVAFIPSLQRVSL